MNVFIAIPVAIFSIIFHELAHGWMALKCGDETARDAGRLTLNPVPHIDFFGTILMPIVLKFLGSGIIFGYAKPVPINPFNFYHYKKGILLTALAGPLSNLSLSVAAAFMMWVIKLVFSGLIFSYAWFIFYYFVIINIWLCVINLIPIPPIDGSRILLSVLPHRTAAKIEHYSRYGFILIIFLFSSRTFQLIIYNIADFLTGLLMKGLN